MQNELNQFIEPDPTILRDALHDKKIAHIQLYGSNLDLNQTGHDIDLLIVLDESCDYERRIVAPFDLIFISRNEALRLAKSFDPVITEPILTGKTIAGIPVIDKWKLKHSEVSQKACQSLYCRAKEIMDWTVSSSGGKQEIIKLLYSSAASNIIQNLTYIASYLAFSFHYSTYTKPLTLKQLCQNYPDSLVCTLRRYAIGIEFNAAEIYSILDLLEGDLSVGSPLASTWVLEGTFKP